MNDEKTYEESVGETYQYIPITAEDFTGFNQNFDAFAQTVVEQNNAIIEQNNTIIEQNNEMITLSVYILVTLLIWFVGRLFNRVLSVVDGA